MNKPQVEHQINGYILRFENDLNVNVRRLTVHSDGDVTGFLEITNSSKKNPVFLLVSSKFTFTADRTRAQFAKQLKDKYPDCGVNFVELFDYLGQAVPELARTGDSVSEVWADDIIPELEYQVEPFVIKGVPNLIFGEKGVNKSTLCYLIAASLFNPEWVNPLDVIIKKPVRSLLLDWENNEGLFRYYLARIKRGCEIPAFSLNYKHCSLPLVDELESVEAKIKSTQSELIIIDSLAAAAGGEHNELKGSLAALQFNTALNLLNITSLIIAQTSKSQEDKKKTIYGSVLFTYYSRNIFELCRSEDNYESTQHLGLFHRECNLDRKHPPIGIRIDYSDDRSIKIEREPLSVSEFAQKVTTQARILDILKSGAMNTKDIAEMMEIRRNTADQVIRRLRAKNKIIRVGDAWGLPTL